MTADEAAYIVFQSDDVEKLQPRFADYVTPVFTNTRWAVWRRKKQLPADFTWEKTARATVDAYRRVVRQPSERSLRMRRCLVDAILRWSEPRSVEPAPVETLPIEPQPLGIVHACNAVNHAVRRRLRRELSRFPAVGGRKRA